MAKPMTKMKAEEKIAAKNEKNGGKGETVKKTVGIKGPKVKYICVQITGSSPLLIHNFSKRARDAMMQKQMEGGNKTRSKAAREPLNPERAYLESRYVNEKGQDCILARAFKKALINAASFTDVSSTVIKGSVFVLGELIPLKYKRRDMREDIARLQDMARTPIFTFRPEYHGWSCEVDMVYDEEMLPLEQLLALIQRAGFSVGVGDWRPNKSGEHGRFSPTNVKTVTEKAA